MKAHLTGYFLTYRCVYLLDSACKGCSQQFFKFVVLFSPIMFLKSDLFYFVLVAKAYGFCLRARPVNSGHILNVLETVKSTRATAKTLTQAGHVAPRFWVLDIRT